MFYPDFVVWDQQSRRSAWVPHILISAFVMNTNIKHFVGPGLGQTCLLIISAADMKIKSAAFMPRAVLRVGKHVVHWRIKADFAHIT